MAEPTIETRTPEQLPRATAVSPDALVTVQEEGGPVASMSIKQLFGRLIATDTAKETRADLYLDLDHDDASVALVYADPDPAKNGWYRKSGEAGAGAWTQFEKLSAQAQAEIQPLIAQAIAMAELAESAAAAAQALLNFRPTIAEGITDFAVGEFFSSPETGQLRIYQRIAGVPFYQDQGDAAAPLTKSLIQAPTAAEMIGTRTGETSQALFDERNTGARAIPHPIFNFLPVSVITCAGPGQATIDFDCETEFRQKYAGLMGTEDFASSAWVDPLNGSDANAGLRWAPFQTVKKAVQKVGVGTIWLLPGIYTERLDIRSSDNLIGGVTARALVIRAVGPLGSVIWTNPGDQPADLVWASAGNSAYTATPPTIDYGAGAVVPRVSAILYKKDGLEDLIPHRAVVGDVTAIGHGWHQDGAGQITIRYANLDLTTAAADDFEIAYARPHSWLVFGARVLFRGIVFRGGQELLVDFEAGRRPHLALQDCKFELSYGQAVTTRGALLWVQDVEINRSSYDGINYYNQAGAATQGTEALEVDLYAHHCGPPETRLWTDNPARNRQSSSGHEDSAIIRVVTKRGAVLEKSSGQNVADTGNTKTWMIGSLAGAPGGYLNGGDYALLAGPYDSIHIEGEAWLDNVATLDKNMTRYGLVATPGAIVHEHNCHFSGATAPMQISGTATFVKYDPRTGADL